VNFAVETITGYTPDEVVGRSRRMLESSRAGEERSLPRWDRLAGEPWSGRFVSRRKDRDVSYEEATISPVVDRSGRIVGYVEVARDVRHLASLEEQLRQAPKMEAVGTVASGMTHDFNKIFTSHTLRRSRSEAVVRRTASCRPTRGDHPRTRRAFSAEKTKRPVAKARRVRSRGVLTPGRTLAATRIRATHQGTERRSRPQSRP